MNPDLDFDTLFDNLSSIDDGDYLGALKKVLGSKKGTKALDFSDLFDGFSMDDKLDFDFDIDIDEEQELSISSPAKKVLSEKEKTMNLIKELEDNKQDIMSLIEKLFDSSIDEDLMYLLQEKLSLFFGYDETSSIDISDEIDKESILLNIIELFNSIDFKTNTLSDKLKINMLKSLIAEYKLLKIA